MILSDKGSLYASSILGITLTKLIAGTAYNILTNLAQ